MIIVILSTYTRTVKWHFLVWCRLYEFTKTDRIRFAGKNGAASLRERAEVAD